MSEKPLSFQDITFFGDFELDLATTGFLKLVSTMH
jgi:hypothetical protein